MTEHNLYVYINVYVVANYVFYRLKSLNTIGTKSSGKAKINQMSVCIDPLKSSNLLRLNPDIARKVRLTNSS